MAWVRVCKKSRWRLTRGSLRTRAGYYYWAPEGTPHFPHPHFFGPREWLSDERADVEPLGEWEGEWERYDGTPPALIPAPRTIGETDCFAYGERDGLPSLPYTPGTPGMMLPLECYRKADLVYDSNVFDCRFHWYAAEIIRLAYNDVDAAKAFAEDYFGATSQVYIIPAGAEDFFPQGIVVKRNGEAFLFMSGTQTPLQWMGHAYTAVDGVIDLGAYSTGRLSELATQRTLAVAVDLIGIVPTRWVVSGHSWGGQIAYIAAAKILIGESGARVDLLTYGMNKPGDAALIDIVAPCRQTHLCTLLDPVPFLPPRAMPAWATEIVNPALRSRWSHFKRPAVVTMVIPGGGVPVRVTADQIEPGMAAAYGVIFAQFLTPHPGSDHFIETYLDRIRGYCPHLIPPYPAGSEVSHFALCDPALQWPTVFNCEIRFGDLTVFNVPFLHTFTGPTFATWTAPATSVTLIDLNGGDADGKIVFNGGIMSFDCGNDHMALNFDIDCGFAIAGVYTAPFTTQNPFTWDVELIEGGAGGPVGSLASPAGDVTRTFTARITGPFLPG